MVIKNIFICHEAKAMNSPRGEIKKRKSHLSFVVKHQGFMYFVLWFLSLKQVFLSRIRFILLIIFRAMFLSILQKKPKDENKMFSISLFLCKEHSLRTLLGDYFRVMCLFFSLQQDV